MSDDLYAQMKQTVIDGEAEEAAALAQKGLDAGLPPADILDEGFVKGIEEVGDLFGRGEFFLPELVQGAEAMKAAVAVLQPALDAAGGGRQTLGVAVAGTVAGDIHEIGKTIVCSMLSAAGFTVTDVGCDVPVETFVEKVKEAGLRDSVKVMIGGAPTIRAWADEIGAETMQADTIERLGFEAKHLNEKDTSRRLRSGEVFRPEVATRLPLDGWRAAGRDEAAANDRVREIIAAAAAGGPLLPPGTIAHLDAIAAEPQARQAIG